MGWIEKKEREREREREREGSTSIEIAHAGERNFFQSSVRSPFVQRSSCSVLDRDHNHRGKGVMKRRSSISSARDKFNAFDATCTAPEPYASDTLSADAQRQIYVAPGKVSRNGILLYSVISSSSFYLFFFSLFIPPRSVSPPPFLFNSVLLYKKEGESSLLSRLFADLFINYRFYKVWFQWILSSMNFFILLMNLSKNFLLWSCIL